MAKKFISLSLMSLLALTGCGSEKQEEPVKTQATDQLATEEKTESETSAAETMPAEEPEMADQAAGK